MDKVKAADTDFVLHYKVNFKTMSFVFDNSMGVTLIDNTIHPEWARRFPQAAKAAQVQQANTPAGEESNPRQRKKKKEFEEAIMSVSNLPPLPLFGVGVMQNA